MNIFTEIRSVLINTAGVTSLVGSGAAAKIWNTWPRTQTVPCVVVEVDREDPENTLDGHGNLTYSDVTITARADTRSQSKTLADAVKLALAGYTGTFDAYFENLAYSDTPKDDGSTGHWYDTLISVNASWTEAI